MSILRIQDLSKSYWQGGVEIPVLRKFSLQLERGEALAITGASGVGKSTLLHCIGLLDSFDSGELFLEGQALHQMTEKNRILFRREKIGFVFQFHYLMAELTALENVMVPLRLQGIQIETCRRRAADWLERVGLGARMNHRPAELSGGEQQRVAIARALVKKPSLILADEPTGNLDPQTASKVFGLFKDCCRESSASLLMTTHNLELAGRLDREMHLKVGAA